MHQNRGSVNVHATVVSLAMRMYYAPVKQSALPKLRDSLSGRGSELGAVVATAAGKFILGDWLSLDTVFIVAAGGFWVVYAGMRWSWNRSVFKRWGLTVSGMPTAAARIGPYAAIGIAFCVVYGLFNPAAIVNRNLFLLLAIYPIWGTVQQLLVVALLADNLVALTDERFGERQAVAIAAVLFGMVHIPELPLIGATVALGSVTTLVFFRTRNVIVPGIVHGWFATLFYYLVMGKDPWAELLELML